jgi:ABC-type transport system substrate-binding protein
MRRKYSRRRFLHTGAAAAAGVLSRGAIAGAAASLFSGCTERRPVEELAKRLTYALIRDIKTLDPCYMEMAVDSYIICNIHETLTWYDRDLQIQPRLATSWEAADDGRTWTFHLRKGVKFHDGNDFNAEAVKFHFERVKNPKNASTRQSRVEFMTGVDAVDEHTVRFRMSKPFSVWPDVIRGAFAAIISPAAARDLKDQKDYTRHPIGTGPYKFVKYVPNRYLLVERNENYWNRAAIHIPEVLFKPIKENTTRLILLEQRNLDIADVFFTHVDLAREGGRFEVQSVPELRVRYIGFNTQKPPFDDPRVRRAVGRSYRLTALFHRPILRTIRRCRSISTTPGARRNC